MSRVSDAERAQASVEVVVLVPALVLVLLCVWQAALAGWALAAAESAARAGARAAMVGRRADGAALAALPSTMRVGATASESEERVVVTLRVPSIVPGFAPQVSASAPVVRQ